jgi:hypothetical protein
VQAGGGFGRAAAGTEALFFIMDGSDMPLMPVRNYAPKKILARPINKKIDWTDQ